jgi:hypothetical protein
VVVLADVAPDDMWDDLLALGDRGDPHDGMKRRTCRATWPPLPARTDLDRALYGIWQIKSCDQPKRPGGKAGRPSGPIARR